MEPTSIPVHVSSKLFSNSEMIEGEKYSQPSSISIVFYLFSLLLEATSYATRHRHQKSGRETRIIGCREEINLMMQKHSGGMVTEKNNTEDFHYCASTVKVSSP